MRAAVPFLGAFLASVLAASAARAQLPYYSTSPVTKKPLGVAPDLSRQRGSSCTNGRGMVYGPIFSVLPPFQPFQGYLPGMSASCPPQGPNFPSHPYARGPRDYFMFMEAQEDLLTRQRSPVIVP